MRIAADSAPKAPACGCQATPCDAAGERRRTALKSSPRDKAEKGNIAAEEGIRAAEGGAPSPSPRALGTQACGCTRGVPRPSPSRSTTPARRGAASEVASRTPRVTKLAPASATAMRISPTTRKKAGMTGQSDALCHIHSVALTVRSCCPSGRKAQVEMGRSSPISLLSVTRRPATAIASCDRTNNDGGPHRLRKQAVRGVLAAAQRQPRRYCSCARSPRPPAPPRSPSRPPPVPPWLPRASQQPSEERRLRSAPLP